MDLKEIQTPDPRTSLEHLQLQAEEHFDDFVIIVRKKGTPYKLAWSMSDRTWAKGAVSRLLQDLEVTDALTIEEDLRPGDR